MSSHYTSIISRVFGKFASKKFHPRVQSIINHSYVKLMGLDMSSFQAPERYSSLNKLFTRAFVVEPELGIDDPNIIISPCDALVTECGVVRYGSAYQIKGMEYNLSDLLGSSYAGAASTMEGGEYVNMYLSPKDYHRYHIPFDLSVTSVTHIPGKLYPVNMPLLKKKVNLFIENERVVIECKDASNNRHFIVLVGALNVGQMVVTFEERISTNKIDSRPLAYKYDEPVRLSRAELFGWFEMGSTILMFSPKNSAKYSAKVGDKISFGDKIGILGS